MFEFNQLFSSKKQQRNFIQNVWQQESVFIKRLLVDVNNIIDGDTLADMSLETEIESRLIFGHDIDGVWDCQHGPFAEDEFDKLPEKDWTLLVQGLDQWNEDISSLLDNFSFLPRWRLEDIMASYAPQGGGVGPHFDYYDVFLLQVSGSREWHLGQQCDETSALQENEKVKLLTEFSIQETHLANAGDLLYIPAGRAHWGTAITDDCITLSVGFRAPSQRELLIATLGNLADNFSEQQRYRDTEQSIDAHPAKINAAVHQELSHYLQSLKPEVLQESINKAFGQLVTEPRYTSIDENGSHDFVKLLVEKIKKKQLIVLDIPIHSRFAFSESQLFVNGEAYDVSETFARGVCEGRVESDLDDTELVYLVELLERGDVELAVT